MKLGTLLRNSKLSVTGFNDMQLRIKFLPLLNSLPFKFSLRLYCFELLTANIWKSFIMLEKMSTMFYLPNYSRFYPVDLHFLIRISRLRFLYNHRFGTHCCHISLTYWKTHRDLQRRTFPCLFSYHKLLIFFDHLRTERNSHTQYCSEIICRCLIAVISIICEQKAYQ